MVRAASRPPQEIAEEALIAGIINHARQGGPTPELHPRLCPEDFIQPSMAEAFRCAMELYAVDVRPVVETLVVQSGKRPGVELDTATLTGLADRIKELSGVSGLRRLSDEVFRFSQLRHIGLALQDGARLVRQKDGDPAEVSDTVQGALTRITAGATNSEPVDTKTAIQRVSELACRDNKNPGRSTGIPELDRMWLYLRPGIVYGVSGRPGHGKTSLLDNIIEHITLDPKVVTYTARLEYNEDQAALRRLATKTGIELSRLVVNPLTHEEKQQVLLAEREFLEGQNFEDYSDTVENMRAFAAKARRLKAKAVMEGKELGLIAVDSIQLFVPEGTPDEEQLIGAMSGAFKRLTQELNVPGIMVSMMNRESEKRPGKIPQLADLRGSGKLESDMDSCTFVFNPSKHDSNAPDDEAYLMVLKNRWGKMGTLTVGWDGPRYRFRPLGST